MPRTTELIDKSTGDRVRVPNDMVPQALRSKKFSVSPENVHEGNIGLVKYRKTELFPTADKKEIMNRLESGYALEPIRDTHKRRLQEEYGDTTLTAMALANNALAQPTMGLSTQIMRRMPYFGASPDALAAIDEMSPAASTIGAVGGVVGDLAFKGPVSLALRGSKKLAAKAGAGLVAAGAGPTLARTGRLAVEGGAEGLAFAEAQLIHENALGNAELTAQTVIGTGASGILWGAGGGALMGAATPLASAMWGTGTGLMKRGYQRGVSAVREGVTPPPGGAVDNIVETALKWTQGKFAYESLQGLKKHTKRIMRQDHQYPWKGERAIRDWMADNNIVGLGDDIAVVDEKVREILGKWGKEIGDFYGTLDEVSEQMVPFGPKPQAMSLPSGTEPIISKVATVIDEKGLFPMTKVLKALDDKIGKENAVMGTTDRVNALKRLRGELLRKYGQRVQGQAGDIPGLGLAPEVAATSRVRRTTFRNAHESMMELATTAGYEKTAKETAKQEASAFLRGAYNKTLETTAEALLKVRKEPGSALFKRWKFLKHEYGKARSIADITEDTLAGHKGGRWIGLTPAIGGAAIGETLSMKMLAVAALQGARKYGPGTISAAAGGLKRLQVVKNGTMSAMTRTVRNFVQGAPSKILGAVDDTTGMTARSLTLPAGVKILQAVSFDPQSPVTEMSEDNVRSATRLTKQLASLVSQPDVVAERVTASLEHIEEIAPNTAKAMVATEVRKLKHLHEVAPKYSYGGSTLQPMAFSEDYITEGDAEKFSRHLHAALQPIPALFNDLADGTLMPETIQTISTVYPQLMEWVRSQFREGYVETKTPIPYATNAMMATLMGEATTRDMTAGFQARHTSVWGGAIDSSMPTMKGIKSSRAAEGARQKNLRPETDRVQSSLIG